MASAEVITHTSLPPELPLVTRGKVRDLYEVDANTLLFVATDRISAYDVILANGVPGKGTLLTRISAFWFSYLSQHVLNLKTHLISLGIPRSISPTLTAEMLASLAERSMLVRKLKVLPLESIVRGYITGSAWAEYRCSGTVHGIRLPAGLQESQKLPDEYFPLWTPSTKAPAGEKDVNIQPSEAVKLVGKDIADKVANLSKELYSKAHAYALDRGIIIADTKFEFGLDESGPAGPQVILVDEVLTPDSSRFWPKEKYEVGKGQDSFDKQFLRDWLTGSGLKGKEGVEMPEDIVTKTREKYEEVVGLLTKQG